MKKLGIIFTLCLLLTFLVMGAVRAEDDGGITYPIMQPDQETLEEWIEAYDNAPRAYIKMDDFEVPSPAGSQNLLDHLEYTASERDQWSCQNCWAWAGTGVMEIALDVQEGVKDRLSVQYINSCQYDEIRKPCCYGGWLYQLADFYDATGMAIPWSNTNAEWQDGTVSCDTSCASISTDPNYPIAYIDDVSIFTQTPNRATAIANIKNVLDQGRGVWFGFYLPNNNAWQIFYHFWNYDHEYDVYDIDQFCGTSYSVSTGGGHAVLCVGYNDDDPNNSYWIMLNSWGTRPLRPNGLFRINMDMNYDGKYSGGSLRAFYWQTLDITFDLSSRPDLLITGKWEQWLDPETKTYSISYTVTNQGCTAAGASTTTITIDGTDVLEDPVPPLAAHASYNDTVGPYTMSGNSDNITVCADNGDVVAESDEANNCRTNSLACPDISIAPAGFNVTLPTDTTQDYTMIIGNDGDAELSYDIGDGDCPWLGESPTSGTVSPGASQNITVTINTTGLATGNYTAQIVIASNDPDEDPTPVPVALHVELPLVGYNITLAAGWNLVSLPVVPDNMGIADVTAGISGDVAIVWGYDTQGDTWLWYVPGDPSSTLTAVEEGLGYWFFMNGPNALEGSGRQIYGAGAPSPAYDVFVGWNLIGFSSTTSMSPESYLVSIAGNYSIIWGYDAEGQTWLWYVPGNPLSTLTTMEPGFGYWLLANADGIIVPPA